MTELLSEARAPPLRVPIGWVARRILASDESVQAVMVTSGDGKVLSHETAIDRFEDDPLDEMSDHPLLFYSSGYDLLFLVRLNKRPADGEVSRRMEAILESPSLEITP